MEKKSRLELTKIVEAQKDQLGRYERRLRGEREIEYCVSSDLKWTLKFLLTASHIISLMCHIELKKHS